MRPNTVLLCLAGLLLHIIPQANFAQCDTIFSVNSTLPFDSCGPANLTFMGPDTVDTWIWDFGDGSTPDSTQNPVHLYNTVANDTQYSGRLFVTCNGGANFDTASFSVTIRATPVVTLTSTALNDTICEIDKITFTANPPGYANYKFYQNGSLVQDFSTNTYLTTFPILKSGDTITVVATSAQGCVSAVSNPKVTFIAGIPEVSISLDSSELCIGESANLSASGGDSYLWQPTGDTASSLHVTPTQTTVYVVTTTKNGCTSIPASRTVFVDTVLVDPGVGLADPNETPCVDVGVELSAAEGLQFEWTYPQGIMVDDPTLKNPTFTFEAEGSYDFVVVITNLFCFDTASTSIEVDRCLNDLRAPVPEVFTPNGDGVNDTWIVPDIDYFTGNSVTIVNQWNTVVFREDNYLNTWKGEDKQGNPLPNGTYAYIVDLGNGIPVKKGFLVIQR